MLKVHLIYRDLYSSGLGQGQLCSQGRWARAISLLLPALQNLTIIFTPDGEREFINILSMP